MTVMSQLLALTPYEAKRLVRGKVTRHYIDARLVAERNKPQTLVQVLHFQVAGESHAFALDLSRFPKAAWTQAGDVVSFSWQERNAKAFDFVLQQSSAEGPSTSDPPQPQPVGAHSHALT